jgi:ABC-2 type transport system permease protein
VRRVLLIARLETRLMGADPFPFLLLIAMPIVLLSFISKGLVGGPAHTVPGLAAMFGLFGMAVVGLAFFRDHGWNTWSRLRASPAGPVEVMLGKTLPLLVLLVIQQVALLLLGWAFFGMPWHGSVAAAALLIAAIVAAEASLGMLLVTICRTIDQLAVASYLGALVLAGFGGALAPSSRLPGWADKVAPVSPVYWMEKGFRVVVVADRPLSELLTSCAVLAGFALGAAAITVWRYRFDAQKTYFA